ncbi:MAG: ferritin-like domain-containing protein [Burkholderiaceae bacterium]|nr:ferritin-like domain-containing protein [Burkholderiaceae bacterium]MEB2318482.1 ferritin-like domain-containing protein [Pseudomonadota bacterium]
MRASVSHRSDALRAWAACGWLAAEPARKLECVAAIAALLDGGVPAEPTPVPDRRALAASEPGRPARPRLVDPRSVPARPVGSAQGRAALLHAIAHIEFNAINLALDAAWRFEMPEDFVRDWLSVAIDEAKHFRLLRDELRARGCEYGDFDAHDGLWQLAWRTRDDVLARMALVPRVMEARGLDATPPLQRRLRGAGDMRAVEILQVILDEEVRHVAIGNRWYHELCIARGVDPRATFVDLFRRHAAPPARGPLNREARLAAGFTEAELDWLSEAAPAGRLPPPLPAA